MRQPRTSAALSGAGRPSAQREPIEAGLRWRLTSQCRLCWASSRPLALRYSPPPEYDCGVNDFARLLPPGACSGRRPGRRGNAPHISLGRDESLGECRLGRLRQHAGQPAPLAVDPDHDGQRQPAWAGLHRGLPRGRRERAARRAVVSRRVERNDVHDDERRQRVGSRSRDGEDQVALYARQRRRLPQLRHRREPRRGVMRRPRFRADARYDDRLPQPRDWTAGAASGNREGRPGRVVELRLFRDERTNLRKSSANRGRGGFRVRRARLRDGVPHGSEPGLAESLLDDPACRHRVAE